MSVPRFCCICLWPGSKLERELRVVRRGSIQPEFARQIARADVFTCCNDGGGKARADLAGFHHGLAVGLADDRAGKEGVARAGRILDVDLFVLCLTQGYRTVAVRMLCKGVISYGQTYHG